MKVVKYVLLSLYLLFVVLNTLLLFTINEFGSSTFGNTIILGLKNKVEKYDKGSLIITTKDIKDIKINDNILYYDVINSKKEIKITKVQDVIKKESNNVVVIEDGLFLSEKYVIGKTNDTTSIPFIGYLYNLFTGKFGYLIFVVIPIICCFIYQLIKYRKENHA